MRPSRGHEIHGFHGAQGDDILIATLFLWIWVDSMRVAGSQWAEQTIVILKGRTSGFQMYSVVWSRRVLHVQRNIMMAHG